MQLKSTRRVRDGLSMAVCGLLAAPGVQAAFLDTYNNDDGDTSGTFADVGGMIYSERGGRVSAKEGVIAIHNVAADDARFDLQLTFDTLSGGSPNGALPSHTVQTFATPSGTSLVPAAPSPVHTCTTPSGVVYVCGGTTAPTTYDVAPGELPLDKTFADQRQAIHVAYDKPVTDTLRLSGGGAYSHEFDYQSLSVNGGLAKDFNRRNTTLAFGANLEHDTSNPVGGTPVPLTDYALFAREGDQSKDVEGVLLGVTQVMTRRWLLRFNLTADTSTGYQNDPYKIVSGLDTSGNVVGYIYENRPDTRTRHGLYWENRVALDRDTVFLSLRATQDDWGVASTTAELRYRYEFGDGRYLEPMLRWYGQSAADFYRLYVVQGDPYLPAVSADPRLGQFTAETVGLKFGYVLDRDSEFSVRAAYYRQQGTVTQPVLPALQGLDLYPDLGAMVIEANLQFRF